MQITKEQLKPTRVKLTITADEKELSGIKKVVVQDLGTSSKVSGFRSGKAPINLIEKQLNQNLLQTEFLDTAVNQLFIASVRNQNLRAVGQPDITVTKFVPFSTLEFTAEVGIIGTITLADYKNTKLPKKSSDATAKDVDNVLESLRTRSAIRKDVQRPSKNGDELLIDFIGTDAKTGDRIQGGSDTNHILVLGSKTMIAGFEDGLVGVKAGEKKDLLLTFPKDYGAAELRSKKVKFEVTVQKVQELEMPNIDDDFVKNLGPFKTVADAKEAIKKDLKAEKERENITAYDNELLALLADKSDVAVPDELIQSEIDRMEEEEKRNLTYRGQTWQEHLDAEGISEEAHRVRQLLPATQRIKGGIILAEIADMEKIEVSPEELEVRIMLLKNQYTDDAMLAELEKPENRRDIHNRMLTEKTLDKLRSFATKR
jgi:trigger factor